MVNQNEKHSYLCETNPRVFIVLEKIKNIFLGIFLDMKFILKGV